MTFAKSHFDPKDLCAAENKTSIVLKNKSKFDHLLYMDDLKLYANSQNEIELLIHTVRIFSDDIGMEFRLDICAAIKMKKREIG